MASTSIPSSTPAWVLTRFNAPPDPTFPTLELTTQQLKSPSDLAANEVLVKLEAVSLNYRDVFMPSAKVPIPNPSPLMKSFDRLAKVSETLPIVPCSDGAGTVLATGSAVRDFKAGDHIVTHLNPRHLYGPIPAGAEGYGLGGSEDGTLRHYAVFAENALVKMPATLSFEEASTLSCAGITAWNALYGAGSERRVGPGDWVLVQGTGGVSTFALKFAVAAGAKVVATTSTREKESLLKEMGAAHVLNYKETPQWGEAAKALTPEGRGFTHIVEVGGPGTLRQSLNCIANDGVITIVGMLGGFTADDDPSFLEVLASCCVVRGVYSGSRMMMEEMCRGIETSGVKPLVSERIYEWEDAKEAFREVLEKKHTGNVVIRLGECRKE